MGSLILNSELYVKEHILQYVIFQLKQGYTYNAIKNALINYGYNRRLVKQVLDATNKQGYKTSTKTPGDTKELTSELYDYVMDMLVDFIKKELTIGYKEQQIKQALMNLGHDEDMIKKASAIIKNKKMDYNYTRPFYFPANSLFLISLLVTFVLFFLLSYMTNVTIIDVYRHFLPGVLTFTIVFLLMHLLNRKFFVRLIPIASIVLTVILFFFFKLVQLFEPNSDFVILLPLNLAVGFIFSMLIGSLSSKNEVINANEIKNEEIKDPRKELEEQLYHHDNIDINKIKHAVATAPENKRIPLKEI